MLIGLAHTQTWFHCTFLTKINNKQVTVQPRLLLRHVCSETRTQDEAGVSERAAGAEVSGNNNDGVRVSGSTSDLRRSQTGASRTRFRSVSQLAVTSLAPVN